MKITFEPFNSNHIPLLITWLKYPHVKEFWQESENEEELREKYLNKLDERGVFPQIISFDNIAIGYIQSYKANQVGGGWWPDADNNVFGMDLFIGEPEFIGKGCGTLIIKQFIQELFQNPQVKEIIVDPEPDNTRSIHVFEKAGFVASGIIKTPNGEALLMRLINN